MFGSPDDGIGIAGSAGTISSINTNSSDDDLLDIRHGGTTSEVTMPNNNSTENSIGSGPSSGGINSSFDTLSGGLVMPSLEDFPEAGMGQYDDFHTIDWQRDIARDRMRHRHIIKKKKESFCDMIRGAHDAWSGWLCVLLVGLCSGVMAGIIDIGATWLTDLKFGICPSAFYLNKEQCCWSSNETVIDISGNCSLW